MNVSVIIPTTDESAPLTVDSVPQSVETVVVRQGNRAQARNYGGFSASGDILAFCDDDIQFDAWWFGNQVSQLDRGEIRGLEDFGLGYLLTRFILVHKTDFWRVGGFDPTMNHMEDTDFCMRAEQQGMDLTALDRDSVTHEPHENDITTRDRIKALGQMTRKHGRDMTDIYRRVV